MNKKIAIIGAGNMGKAISSGLINNGVISQSDLVVIDKQDGIIGQDIQVRSDLSLLKDVDIILLAVKPQDMKELLISMKNIVTNQLIISIAAGITIISIEEILGLDKRIARVMPNLNAKIGKSISVWSTNNQVNEDDKADICHVLQAIGKEIYVSDEKLIDAATAISGSGPAYIFLFCELLQNAAVQLGFNQEEADILVKETLIGSAELIDNTGINLKVLREQVTSKGGTTEAALSSFEHNNLSGIIFEAVQSAERRANELQS